MTDKWREITKIAISPKSKQKKQREIGKVIYRNVPPKYKRGAYKPSIGKGPRRGVGEQTRKQLGPIGKDEFLQYEIKKQDEIIKQLKLTKKNIQPNQYYTFTDPETGNPQRLLGYQIITRYIDPLIKEGEEDKRELLLEQQRFRKSPKYRRAVSTPEGYTIYDSSELYEEYQKSEWDNQPLVTKIGRVVIGATLYGPKLIMDTLLAGGRYGKGPEKALESFQEGVRWEGEAWEKKLKGDYFGVAKQFYTSPLAVTTYTYAAFNLGGRFIKFVAPTGKKVIGRVIPQVIKDYPSRFADIRIAKIIDKGLTKVGTPTYISGRGELLYGGKILDRFAGKPSIWGGYGTSYSFYRSSIISEYTKQNLYPYEKFASRPKFIETSRTYLRVGDDVTFISKGFTRSFFRPKIETRVISSKPMKDVFDLRNVKRFYIDDKVIAAELKTSPFRFKQPDKIISPIDTRDFSKVSQLLKISSKTKPISRFEWYQEPLRQYTSKVSLAPSIRMPDMFSMAYGKISLSTLDFLEAGLVTSSGRWAGVKPKMLSLSGLSLSPISLSESALALTPMNMLKLGVVPISLSLQQSRLQTRQLQMNKLLRIDIPQMTPPTTPITPRMPRYPPEPGTPKIPKIPLLDDSSGLNKKFSKFFSEEGEIGYRIKKWKFPKMEDFLKGGF